MSLTKNNGLTINPDATSKIVKSVIGAGEKKKTLLDKLENQHLHERLLILKHFERQSV